MVTRIGTPDADTLDGSLDADILRGLAGDDWLSPLTGADLAYGGADNDTIAFVDLSGGQAFGGSGVDRLDLYLENGPALFLDFRTGSASQAGTVPGTLTFTGMEFLILSTFTDNDTVVAGNGNDNLWFGGSGAVARARGGDDIVRYSPNLAVTLDGGEGNDLLQVVTGDNVLYFIVDTFDGTVDDGQLSQITGFETYQVTGGTFADIVSLDQGNDTFSGQEGADTAFGDLGDDSLIGGEGNDSLDGEAGDDALTGGSQDDILFGGLGKDRLGGGRGQDVVDGGAGRDRILLHLGNDVATGGFGADKFVFFGTETGLHTLTDFVSGLDQVQFNRNLLQFGPVAGPLDPSLLSFGTATGSQAQFVLTYDAGDDRSALHWDPNGENPAGGTYLLAYFTGQITLTADDILIL